MQLKWEIEDKCNLNCKHCIVGSIDYSKSMALDTAMEVIDKCASSGIDTIALTTKEPFMYPHINELIEYSALHNMQIAILTNGTLINKKNMHTLQKYSSNIKYLFFSLEGVSEYTNDYVRGEGVFRKVLEVANEINEINKKNDSFISMVLQMNLTSKNYSEVLGMVEKFNTFPFIQVRIGKLEIEGNAILHKELHLDNEDYKEAIRKLIYTYSQIDKPKYDLIFKSLSLYDTIYLNTIFGTSYKPSIPKCSVFDGGLSLMNNGDYCSCTQLLDKNLIDKDRLILGNIEDGERINTNKKLETTPEMFSYKENTVCKKCNFREICKVCLLTTLSKENNLSQVGQCKVYMDKLDDLFNAVISKNLSFGFNKNVVIIENNERLIVKNANIADDKNWEYSTDNNQIKDILKKIYKSGYVQYEDLKDEFKGIEVYNCIYEWMYSSLIVVNNVEY